MLCAFQGRCEHCGHDHGNPFDLPNMTNLSEAIRQQQATIDRLKSAFHINMISAYPEKSHAEISALIAEIEAGNEPGTPKITD